MGGKSRDTDRPPPHLSLTITISSIRFLWPKVLIYLFVPRMDCCQFSFVSNPLDSFRERESVKGRTE